jgi:hypothetical protein
VDALSLHVVVTDEREATLSAEGLYGWSRIMDAACRTSMLRLLGSLGTDVLVAMSDLESIRDVGDRLFITNAFTLWHTRTLKTTKGIGKWCEEDTVRGPERRERRSSEQDEEKINVRVSLVKKSRRHMRLSVVDNRICVLRYNT